MQKLLDKIKKNKIAPMSLMTGAKIHKHDVTLNLDINDDVTPFEKSIDKDYALEEKVNLSEEFKHIFDVRLYEFGFKFEGQDELEYRFGDGRREEVTYSVDRFDLFEKSVYLKGSFFGDPMYLSSAAPFHAILNVFGLTKSDAKKMQLYQDLIVEGHVLEVGNSFKMSFFSYFSAIEALLAFSLEEFRNTLPNELHEPLEHLSLDDKVRIASKIKLSTNDLKTIPLWGDFMGKLKQVKSLRNEIAHGRVSSGVSKADVDDCFLCLTILYSIVFGLCRTIDESRKFIYPDTLKKRR